MNPFRIGIWGKKKKKGNGVVPNNEKKVIGNKCLHFLVIDGYNEIN
jgi:hypothetical protein